MVAPYGKLFMDSLYNDDQIRVLGICVMIIESGKNEANLVTSLSTCVKVVCVGQSHS